MVKRKFRTHCIDQQQAAQHAPKVILPLLAVVHVGNSVHILSVAQGTEEWNWVATCGVTEEEQGLLALRQYFSPLHLVRNARLLRGKVQM